MSACEATVSARADLREQIHSSRSALSLLCLSISLSLSLFLAAILVPLRASLVKRAGAALAHRQQKLGHTSSAGLHLPRLSLHICHCAACPQRTGKVPKVALGCGCRTSAPGFWTPEQRPGMLGGLAPRGCSLIRKLWRKQTLVARVLVRRDGPCGLSLMPN